MLPITVRSTDLNAPRHVNYLWTSTEQRGRDDILPDVKRAPFLLGVLLAAGSTAFILSIGSASASHMARHAGRVHSMIPHEGVLIIEDVGANNAVEKIKVDIRNARILRVWRDPDRPGRWQERPTRAQRLSVGTFVVVIGKARASGVVEADWIEVPKVGNGK